MEKINYVNGDATEPIGDGKKIIVHVCNNLGLWGSGFVMAISNKWKKPEEVYRAMNSYELGTFNVITVEDDIMVCNLIGQEGVYSPRTDRRVHKNIPPVRYVAIETALKNLAYNIKIVNSEVNKHSIHMPMIGSGLAGGNWSIIEKIIEVTLCDVNIPVTVYKFN